MIVLVSRKQAGRPAVPGSGNVISQIKPLEGFTRLNIGNAFHVEIKESPQFSVSLSADDNVINLVEVEKEGDTLRIGIETGDYREVTLRARITMPELLGVMLTGSSRATLEGFSSANDLSISLSGASVLEGYVEAREADLRINGASKLTLAGSADNLLVRASGASVPGTPALLHRPRLRGAQWRKPSLRKRAGLHRERRAQRRLRAHLRWRPRAGRHPDLRRIQDRAPAERRNPSLLSRP